MTRIEITNVADLRDGDIATFQIDGREYTGPVYEDGGGYLRFVGHVIVWSDGDFGHYAQFFTSATRELKLPTDPLSVITDVVTTNGGTFPFAVRDDVAYWGCFDSVGSLEAYVYGKNIVSFKLAKVVEA